MHSFYFLLQKHQIGQDNGCCCFDNGWHPQSDTGIMTTYDFKLFNFVALKIKCLLGKANA